MVTAADRARMQRIAVAMAEANADAVHAAALRQPAQNIELGLRLGDAALLVVQHEAARPDEVAPSRLWRERKKGRAPR